MDTNMTGLDGLPKILASLQVLWMKIASSLEGLSNSYGHWNSYYQGFRFLSIADHLSSWMACSELD